MMMFAEPEPWVIDGTVRSRQEVLDRQQIRRPTAREADGQWREGVSSCRLTPLGHRTIPSHLRRSAYGDYRNLG
ncbi:hypothetical protein SCOCK_140006 [Actinacidiphila cocklensis]|uniref:Uncharacterized protein n=1 Tax=Actinacidiphila cocklensis TaxID=887465 RepID=A0A9W4DPU1_9ACTN|nr:hypothetical protein SCOCK_140006 [Actinacidiphila cocklensis]